MSELSSETNPQILVNGEEQEPQQDDAATTEAAPDAPDSVEGERVEDSAAAEKETQAKVQNLFQQVRSQIRSQGGSKAPKSSILELVQRVLDREVDIAQVNSEDKDVSNEEEKEAELLTGESKDSDSVEGECLEDSAAAEKETQAKIVNLFQQVRSQIRSQGGSKAPKSSILDLVQRVLDREVDIAQVNSEPEDKDVSNEEEKDAELLTGESKDSDTVDDACLEDSAAAQKETHAKVQNLFQQVRGRIRSQGVSKAPKSSILELVQKVLDREVDITQVNSEEKDVSNEEEKEVKMFSKDEATLNKEELCAMFEEKLEASKKGLRDEFEQQISQVRKEMQAYTDRALKELEGKIQSGNFHSLIQTHGKEAQEGKGQDRNRKPAAAPSLASRRGRLLTRTMTTITPKTCAPVIVGPRAKSETLTSSKVESSRFLPRDPATYLPANKSYHNRKPFPPACPPLYQCKKPVRPQAKTKS